LKSLARDSIYSRLAGRFATAADTNSSTDTWSFAGDLSGLIVQILGCGDAPTHFSMSSSIVLKMSNIVRDDGVCSADACWSEEELVARVAKK
jgi:hypothetical protein